MPEPSIISPPLSESAAMPAYRSGSAESHGHALDEKRRTGEPDPDAYCAGRSYWPMSSIRDGRPVTVTASVKLTMMSKEPPARPSPWPGWW